MQVDQASPSAFLKGHNDSCSEQKKKIHQASGSSEDGGEVTWIPPPVGQGSPLPTHTSYRDCGRRKTSYMSYKAKFARLSTGGNEVHRQAATRDLREQSSRHSPEAWRPPALRRGPAAADVGPRPHCLVPHPDPTPTRSHTKRQHILSILKFFPQHISHADHFHD